MSLSAPIHILKREARQLARAEAIALHTALDRIAAREGYRAWSLLMAKLPARTTARTLLSKLEAGDLVLLAARPAQGKTRLSMELLFEGITEGRHGAFFTLEYAPQDVVGLMSQLGLEEAPTHLRIDTSDVINADYVIEEMAHARHGDIIVIDYLQILDQRREHPSLMSQVRALRAFAQAQGVIIVCISQVDRGFNADTRVFPGPDDVRLPNPLDLNLFTSTCFVSEGRLKISNT